MDQNAVEYIKNHIKEFLPLEYQDADVIVKPVVKNNDRVLTGLTVLKDGGNMAPTVYLEPYWEEVEKGRLLSSVLEEIAQIQTGENNRGPFDLSMMKDYEKVKPKLFIRMCDPEKNTEYLKDKPYTACGELAASYRIQSLSLPTGIKWTGRGLWYRMEFWKKWENCLGRIIMCSLPLSMRYLSCRITGRWM